MFENATSINRALSLLAERLEYAGAPGTNLLVGGGSALNVLGLVKQTTTKDIDVIALVQEGSRTQAQSLSRAEPLPAYLEIEVRNVAQDLELPEDWLNAGPTSLVDFGLPEGCLKRAEAP